MKRKTREHVDRPMIGCHVHGCDQFATLVLECEPVRGYCDRHDPRMETGALEIIIDVSKALAGMTRQQMYAFHDIENAQEGNLDIRFDFDPDGVVEEEAAHTDDPERRADLERRLQVNRDQVAYFGTFKEGE